MEKGACKFIHGKEPKIDFQNASTKKFDINFDAITLVGCCLVDELLDELDDFGG